jgi:MOSC domain-containing protein YiiM
MSSPGVDLNELIGEQFEIDGVKFLGVAECSPCRWMDKAFCPGAEKFLRGNGGLRAKILTNGVVWSANRDRYAPSKVEQ